MPQIVREWRTFGNCFHRMVRSVVDFPGTASQILLEENVHYALAVTVVGDQTGVATETWSSMNCPVVMVVVAEDPCELNSLDNEPVQKPHLALEIVLCSLLLEVVVVVVVRHLAGAEVQGTGDSIVVMGVGEGALLPDCTLAVLLFGVVVVGVLFDCTFCLFCLHENYPGTRVDIILVIFFSRPSNISGLSSLGRELKTCVNDNSG